MGSLHVQFSEITSFERWVLQNASIPDPLNFLPSSKSRVAYHPSDPMPKEEEILINFVFSYCHTRTEIYTALSNYGEVQRSTNYFFYHRFESENEEFQERLNLRTRFLALLAVSCERVEVENLYFSLQMLHRISSLPCQLEEEPTYKVYDKLSLTYGQLFQETGNKAYLTLAEKYLKKISPSLPTYKIAHTALKKLKSTQQRRRHAPEAKEKISFQNNVEEILKSVVEEGNLQAQIMLFSKRWESFMDRWSSCVDMSETLVALKSFEDNVTSLLLQGGSRVLAPDTACTAEDVSSSKDISLKELYDFYWQAASESKESVITTTVALLIKGGSFKEALDRLDATQHLLPHLERSIKEIRAHVKNLMGQPEDLYMLMLETKEEREAYLKKKREERQKRNAIFYKAIRVQLQKTAEADSMPPRELLSRASGVKVEPNSQKRTTLPSALSIDFFPSYEVNLEDKEEKKRRHERSVAEREEEKKRDELEFQNLLENDQRTILDLYADDLTTAARNVEEKISANDWNISREELERYFISLGCTRAGGKGSHLKLSLPDAVIYAYNGKIITILTSTLVGFEGGSVVLPNIDKAGFVKFYLRDQILAARKELRKLAILKEMNKPLETKDM